MHVSAINRAILAAVDIRFGSLLWCRRLAVGFALGAGAAAHAQDYATREVGGWAVSASSDGQGCFLTKRYEGPRNTTLLLGLDVDGGNRLTILNANWSVREKERLKLDFRFSQASFPQHLAIGLAADGKRGFVSSFGTRFPTTFATSRFLHITRGKVRIEELDLAGSGAAVAELRRCVDRYRDGGVTASSRKDTSRIPVDPFAVKDDRRSGK